MLLVSESFLKGLREAPAWLFASWTSLGDHRFASKWIGGLETAFFCNHVFTDEGADYGETDALTFDCALSSSVESVLENSLNVSALELHSSVAIDLYCFQKTFV